MNKLNKNIRLPFKGLTNVQFKALKMQLTKLNLYNKLLLTINKRIYNYPHIKINDKMGSYLNQNIVYNFSKSSTPNSNIYSSINNNKNNIFKYTYINNSARIGIINFVLKIIISIFNSLSCIIGKPQFINKHDKLIIRIPYYQNNIQKDPLFTNINSNNIFNSLTNNLSTNNVLNTNDSMNLTKNIWIKWLKDYFHLNIDNLKTSDLNNKFINLNTIDNYIKNNKVIDNKILNSNLNSTSIIKSNKSKSFKNKSINRFLINKSQIFKNRINLYKKTNLLNKINRSNSFDYLNAKRLSNLKITSNKLLMLKIIKNLNYHNEKSTEILGKGSLLQPVFQNNLDKIFGGVYDSKGYLGDLNFSNEYKIISNKLLATNLNKNNLNIINVYSKDISALNKISKNKLIKNLKLIKNINQKLINLKSQFANKNNESINFILNNIIKQINPTILFYNSFIRNNKNSLVKLFILNRQLSLINKLGVNLLAIEKINNSVLSNIDYAKFLLNIKILKLIIKNSIIFDNNLIKVNSKSIKNNDSDLLKNKIKESFLAFESYNNKAKNNHNILNNNIVKFRSLGVLLSKIFKKNVSIELIRLWNVGLDSTILSKIISKNSTTDKSSVIFKKLWRKMVISQVNKLTSARQNKILESNNIVYNNINKFGSKNINKDIEAIIPYKSKIFNNTTISGKKIKLLNKEKSNLKLIQINDFINNINIYNSNPITLAKTVGVSIKIGGRLARERIQPKRTVKIIKVGSIKGDKAKVIDSYKCTSKNKRGAYTITVKLAHSRC